MAAGDPGAAAGYLQSFRLYETLSNFYMIGRDKSKSSWRVLKIDRSDPCELNIIEDDTVYSESECNDLMMCIHEGNKDNGGLKFVTNCYGIIGFVKFLGPYYMILITKRRKIGAICGHTVYAISKSEMIVIKNSSLPSNLAHRRAENRYKKLLGMVDLTKDFFFSYSYHIMRSLQKNFCSGETGQVLYETMFVWNEFLTRGIRNYLKNTIWTVALVHGFFKQADLSIYGKDFKFTLIARRSRHFAGTRYLKRGVNVKGRVANDVETEQIVAEDTSWGVPTRISSIVQNRGSVPLFWSQETSWRNMKPDIVLHKTDEFYEATRLHFENLAKRYGNPIIILNLIKKREKKPRESKLRREFVKAIEYLNEDLPEESRLRFLHLDLHEKSRRKNADVLGLLVKVAAYALISTGFFYYQVTSATGSESSLKWPPPVDSGSESSKEEIGSDENSLTKLPILQTGVVRTNCIDCLDRTNVAQYAIGLAALGNQLHALGFIDVPHICHDDPVVDNLMHLYERMGDTLALQYGGSPAHNKIFSERRGQWKAAIQSQEFLRSMQRYYSNTYLDAEKQDAINVFLGHFQPQEGKPAIWELDSDHSLNVGSRPYSLVDKAVRSSIKRSQSDGSLLWQGTTPMSRSNSGKNGLFILPPESSTHQAVDLPGPSIHVSNEHDASPCSNFVNLQWLSSGSSLAEEAYDWSSQISSPIGKLSTEKIFYDSESAPTISERDMDSDLSDVNSDALSEFSDTFVNWVTNGSTLSH